MTPETSIYEYARQGLNMSADKTAIWFYGKSITYRELFHCIDNAADNLYRLGVRQGTVVTIHLPSCPQVVMAIYAVAKLGGICNMVHPQLTLEGLRRNMEFVQSTMLITRADFIENNETDFAQAVVYVRLNSMKEACAGESITRNGNCFETLLTPCVESAVVPEQDTLGKSCVCYLNSSGTTGTPKTVMLSHSAINEWSRSAEVYFRTHTGDPSKLVWLSAVPPFHGMGFAGTLHHVVSTGGKQVQMAKWDAEGAVHAIKEYGIDVLAGVPTMYVELMGHTDFGRCGGNSLRLCFVSGERTDIQLKKAMMERFGGRALLIDCYGLTETVACRCVADSKNYRFDCIGYPMDGCDFAVMDCNGQLRRCGTGELLISSGCNMMGYLKDNPATMEVLIKHQGKTWVKTGDYGRIDEDGSIFFLERVKETIIRKGCNIYPAEIEATIRQLSEVRDVCVVGVMSTETFTQKVRACIVAENDCDPDELKARIEHICVEKLPRYSVPEEIRFFSRLPRTKLGKTDRKALEQIQ